MPTLVWFINPDAPEKFYQKLRGVDYSDLKQLLPVLMPANTKGWVTIVGASSQEPEDVAAVIGEHFDASAIICRAPKPAVNQKTRKRTNE